MPSPSTRFRGAPARAAFPAPPAAPPISSSEPTRSVISGSTPGTSIAPRAGTWAFRSAGLVWAVRTAMTHNNEMRTMTITAALPARGPTRRRNEPIPSPPAFQQPAEEVVALVGRIGPAAKLADGFERGRHAEHGQRQRPDRLVGLATSQVLPAHNHREGCSDHGRNEGDQEHRGQ